VHCSVCGCVDGAAFATRLLSLYATVAHRSSVIPSSHRRRKIDALQPNPRLSLVTITSWGNSPMETLPPYQEAHALPTRSVPTQARLAIHSVEISTVMTEHREVTDEELELIEMRYQHALAIQNLEALFAEGLLNCK
jgi:hypothetical protein